MNGDGDGLKVPLLFVIFPHRLQQVVNKGGHEKDSQPDIESRSVQIGASDFKF